MGELALVLGEDGTQHLAKVAVAATNGEVAAAGQVLVVRRQNDARRDSPAPGVGVRHDVIDAQKKLARPLDGIGHLVRP